MSADVGAENAAPAKKTPKKRPRARPTARRERPSVSRRQPPALPNSARPAAPTPALETTVAPPTVSPAESVVPRATRPVEQQPPAQVRPTVHLRTIAVAGVACLVVAALAFPRHPPASGTDDRVASSQPVPREPLADIVAPSPQPAERSAAQIAAPAALAAAIALPAVSAPSKKTLAPRPDNHGVAETTKFGATAAATAPVSDIPLKEDAAAMPSGSEAIAPPAPVSIVAGGTMPVTITGCLEISVKQDEFRLTDTEGVDAPRSRSWRMGFLKKRSAPVALVEPPDGLALQSHVGRRVAATGLLSSHDLKVSALRVVGPSCN